MCFLMRRNVNDASIQPSVYTSFTAVRRLQVVVSTLTKFAHVNRSTTPDRAYQVGRLTFWTIVLQLPYKWRTCRKEQRRAWLSDRFDRLCSERCSLDQFFETDRNLDRSESEHKCIPGYAKLYNLRCLDCHLKWTNNKIFKMPRLRNDHSGLLTVGGRRSHPTTLLRCRRMRCYWQLTKRRFHSRFWSSR